MRYDMKIFKRPFEEMDELEQFRDKILELWDLQLRINVYVGETEQQLDPAVEEIFTDSDPPEWFNSGIVLSPLILAFDRKMKELEERVEEKQKELEMFLNTIPEPPKEKKEESEKVIDQIRKEIEILQREINEMPELEQYRENTFNEKRVHFYNSEIEFATNKLMKSSSENAAIQEQIDQYVLEIKKVSDEQIELCKYIKQNYLSRRAIKAKLKKLDKICSKSAKLIGHYQEHYNKYSRMTQGLTDIKNSNDIQIKELEEEYKNHLELITSMQNTEKEIKECGAQQEKAIERMLEAADIAEKAFANSQFDFMEYKSCEEELKRIQAVIRNTEEKFDKNVNEIENKIRAHYDPILSEYENRIQKLITEANNMKNEQIVLDERIEMVSKRNGFLFQDIDMITNANSSEFVMRFREEIEAAYEQKKALSKENDGLRKNISEISSKQLSLGSNQKSNDIDLSNAKKRLEVDIGIVRSKLNDVISGNLFVSESNERLKSTLKSLTNRKKSELSHQLEEKQTLINNMKSEIEKIESETEAMNSSHTTQVQRIKAQIGGLKSNAFITQNEDAERINAIMSEAQSAKDAVEEYQQIFNENKNQFAKGTSILHKVVQSTTAIKTKIINLKKKERIQTNLISDLISQQMSIQSENKRLHEALIKINKKINEEKKRMVLIGKLENYDAFSDDDQQEIMSDPL